MPSPDLFTLLKRVWEKHGFSASVTLNTLSLGVADAVTGWYSKSYAASTISMFVLTKRTGFLVTGQGLFIEYDANGYTKDTVHEGDTITEPNGKQHLVLSVCDRYILNQFRYSEVGLKTMLAAVSYGVWNKWDDADAPFNKIVKTIERNAAASALTTLYKLTLGSPDAVTGWYKPSYSAGVQIKCPMLECQAETVYHQTGVKTSYSHLGYALDDVFEGDIIKDLTGDYHRIREVKPFQIGDHLVYYELKLELLDEMTVDNLIPP